MGYKLKPFISIGLAALLVQTPSALAAAGGGSCEEAVKRATKTCPENIQGLATGAAVTGTMNGGADQMVDKANQAATHANDIKAKCSAAETECRKSCKSKEEAPKCDPFASRASMAGQEAAQATNAGQQASETAGSTGSQEGAGGQQAGGGMDPGMMAGLLGAAGGIMAAMMMNKKKDNQQQPPQMPPQTPPNGALQANGTIDCSKQDATSYSQCNDHLVNQCVNNLADARCQIFAARYCGSAGSTGSSTGTLQANLPTGRIPSVEGLKTASGDTNQTALLGFGGALPGGSGEGLGTSFCKTVIATNYCKQTGRDKCPSCVQLQINKSPICVNDPALCVAQNSPEQINQAKLSCPTDPAFSDPTFANGGGAQVPPQVAKGGGLNPPVLPQQDGLGQNAGGNSGGGTLGTTTGGGTGGGGGGISTSSIRPASANGNAVAEGHGGSGGGGGSYGPSSYGGGDRVGGGGSGRGGVYRETASAGGYQPASARGTGPASDVQGQYGLSVFALGSQTLRNRCAAGKLLNCP